MPFKLEGAADSDSDTAPKKFKLDGASDAKESKEINDGSEGHTAYGRGQIPYTSYTRYPNNQDALDSLMMLPSVGAEMAAFKGMNALENIATRAYPKVAQTMAEGKVAPFLAKTAKTAIAGGEGGGVYAAGTNRDIPAGVAVGSAGATGLQVLGTSISKGYGALRDYFKRADPEFLNNTALQKVLSRFEKDQKGGGLSAQQAMELVDESRKTGKPMILPDVSGTNVRKLAGSVARSPGESSEIAQGFLNKRDAEASKRLTEDTNRYLSSESGRKTAESLAKMRSVEGKPLFEEAYKGGSMAPLESQFSKTWSELAGTSSKIQNEISKISPRITTLKAKISQTNNVYSLASLNKELQSAEKDLLAKQAELSTAKMQEAEAHQVLQKAQADRSASAPGAIWNPRIQRLLELPEVKSGINEGIRLERLNAASDGRAFNAMEYAIVGQDAAGNPIIGKVPNMRLLASAKEGLDSMLEKDGMRDPNPPYRLTKLGVAVDKVRRSLRRELISANPGYEKALNSWAGHSQSMDAARFGRSVFREQPEEIAARVAEMSESEREFAKVGVADMVRERILKTGFGGDEANAIIKSEWAKMQLRPFFKNEREFNSFVKAVTDERAMFESKSSFIKGSQSAERLTDDASNNVMDASFKAATGNYTGAMKDALKSFIDLGKKSNWKNEKINEAVAKILFNPDIQASDLILKSEASKYGNPIVKSLPYMGMVGAEQLVSPR